MSKCSNGLGRGGSTWNIFKWGALPLKKWSPIKFWIHRVSGSSSNWRNCFWKWDGWPTASSLSISRVQLAQKEASRIPKHLRWWQIGLRWSWLLTQLTQSPHSINDSLSYRFSTKQFQRDWPPIRWHPQRIPLGRRMSSITPPPPPKKKKEVFEAFH